MTIILSVVASNTGAKKRQFLPQGFVAFSGNNAFVTLNRSAAATFNLQGTTLMNGALFAGASTSDVDIGFAEFKRFTSLPDFFQTFSVAAIGSPVVFTNPAFTLAGNAIFCESDNGFVFSQYTIRTPFNCVTIQLIAESRKFTIVLCETLY